MHTWVHCLNQPIDDTFGIHDPHTHSRTFQLTWLIRLLLRVTLGFGWAENLLKSSICIMLKGMLKV